MHSISSQYKKALVDYYKLNPSKNGVGIDEKEKLANKIIERYNPASIFDFGCGQNYFLDKINNIDSSIETFGYDPGMEQYDTYDKQKK